MSLVKEGGVDEMGNPSYGGGLIEKEATETMKFEWFTLLPIDIYFVATAGSSTTATISSTANFAVRDVVVNLTTMEVGVVNTVTSSTVLTITNVTSAWSCAAGDVIAMACNTHEEGDANATSRTQEPDNNYNYVFPFRFAVSIADTAVNSPHYGEALKTRYKKDNMYLALRNLENNLILGQRPASGDTTSVTIGGTAYNMFSTRGLWQFASNSINAGGALTFDDFQSSVFLGLPKTQSPDKALKMLCGRNIFSIMLRWANQKLIYMENGDVDEMGVRPKRFQCGAYTIEPMLHDLFDYGSLASSALVFDPSDIKYRFKTGMDLQTKDNIQTPATWGTTDEIRGVVGIQVMSGGANLTKITNWTA